MPASLSLAIVRLGADIVKPGSINTIRLTVSGFNQFFSAQFFEDSERTIGEQHPFAAVAHAKLSPFLLPAKAIIYYSHIITMIW